MLGFHILHVFIAELFKIDADTVIISGSALICSLPFVPVIAGYAVGNYLGVLIAVILK